MGVETHTFIWRGEDQLSDVSTKVRKGLVSTEEAGKQAGEVITAGLRRLGEEGANLIPQLDRLSKKFTDLGEFADEGSQKILDAQKKLTEFGGSAKDLAAGFEASINASTKFGVSITRTSAALEELAIRTENPKQAVQLLDRAMQLAIRTNQKAEDAAGDLANAYKGQTDALKSLSGRGERYANLLDKIKDPAKRAKEGVRLLNKELDSQPSLIDKASDKFAVFRVRASELAGGLDIVGGGLVAGGIALGALAVGAAAAASAVADFTEDSLKAFLATNEDLTKQIDQLNLSIDVMQTNFGEAVAKGVGLETQISALNALVTGTSSVFRELGSVTDEFTGSMDFVNVALIAGGASLEGWFGLGGLAATATRDLSDSWSEYRQEVQDTTDAQIEFADTLGDLLDDLAEQEKALDKVGKAFDKILKKAAADAKRERDAEARRRKAAGQKALRQREQDEAAVLRATQKGEQDIFKELEKFDARKRKRLDDFEKFRLGLADDVLAMNRQIAENASQLEADIATKLAKVRGTFQETADAATLGAAQKLVGTGEASSLENAQAQVEAAEAGASRMEIAIIRVANVSKDMAGVVGGAFTGITSAIGSGIAGMTQQMVEGTFTLKGLASTILGGLGDLMITTGGQLVLMGTLSLNPATVAGGVALMAAGGALKGTATKAAGGTTGAGAPGGATATGASTSRNQAARAESEQDSLERKFPDDRDRRAEVKRREKEQVAEDDARAKFREQTFLAAVDKTLAADRDRNRENREIFQTFEGRIAQSSAAVDGQVRTSVQRLQRTQQLVGLNGYPQGLNPRR